MKKLLLSIMMCVMSVFGVFGFIGCGSKDNRIRINEVTHSIFYAPLYVAISNGYFAEEGLNVTLTNGASSQVSMNALIAGSADVILAGPETAVYVANQDAANQPVIFGQLTKRDGSFLVARSEDTDFNYSKLAGKHVIAGRQGGMPAMTLQYVLENKGLTLGQNTTDNKVYFDLSVPFANTIPVFQDGRGDYVTMFEPSASDYVEKGLGYIVSSIGKDSGEVPYTAFMTKSSYLKNNKANLEKFLRAVKKGYNYIMTASLDDVAKSLELQFLNISLNSIKASIKSYKEIDAWCESPVMKESAFNALQDIIENAGELTKRASFSKVVDNSIAQKV